MIYHAEYVIADIALLLGSQLKDVGSSVFIGTDCTAAPCHLLIKVQALHHGGLAAAAFSHHAKNLPVIYIKADIPAGIYGSAFRAIVSLQLYRMAAAMGTALTKAFVEM